MHKVCVDGTQHRQCRTEVNYQSNDDLYLERFFAVSEDILSRFFVFAVCNLKS